MQSTNSEYGSPYLATRHFTLLLYFIITLRIFLILLKSEVQKKKNIFFVNYEILCKKKKKSAPHFSCHYRNSVCFSPLSESDFN